MTHSKIFQTILRRSVLLLCILWAYTFNARAANIYVNHAATGAQNGNSWQNAHTTIEAAISQAVAGDVIWVAQGTYRPGNARNSRYNMKNNVHLVGGFTGSETQLSQANPFQNPTLISGEIGDPSDPEDNIEMLMRFRNIATATIRGFRFKDAYTTGFIGAIEIEASSPTFQLCTFENNQANGSFSSGGAITVTGFDGPSEPYFVSCSFIKNRSSVIGGAVHTNNSNCRSYFLSCLFEGNEAQRGGAIHNGGGSLVLSFNSTFTRNTANLGSATFTTSGGGTSHRNDVIWNNSHNAGSSATAVASSNTTLLINYSIVQGGFSGTQNLNTNPLFVNANLDFSLQENSPARNSGDPDFDYTNYPVLDAAGNRRITYGRIDRGAFEFGCKTEDQNETLVTLESCGNYTSPLGITYTQSGTYQELYSNSIGCDSLVTIQLTVVQANTQVLVENNRMISQANNPGASYQWLNCNQGNAPIPGATQATFEPVASGLYAVRIQVGSCTFTSECFNFFMASAMNPAGKQAGWSIYPNPASQKVTINTSQNQSELTVIDMHGKQVHSQIMQAGTNVLDCSKLKPGVYFVTLMGATQKLVLY